MRYREYKFIGFQIDITDIKSFIRRFSIEWEYFLKNFKRTPIGKNIGSKGGVWVLSEDGKLVPANRYKPQYKSLAKNFDPLGAIHREGVKIFENGKRRVLETKTSVKEHAAKNNLIFGSDDLEEQSLINKKRIDQEHTEKVVNNIMESYNKLQYLKIK